MLDDVITRNVNDAQTDKNHAVMMLRGKYESAALAQSSGWDDGAPEAERNLEGAFPGLTLAIKLRGTTLAAIGERFARISFLTLAALSLVLAGGIALTYRNVTKEMALARLKSDFVSNVSHELRTPLSLIRLYAETLEMGRLTSPEKYQEYYCIIRKESERLTALINNILDFSRIEAGRKEYDFRETDMSELVHNTLDSYRYQMEQSGFQFEEKIDDVPPMRVDREAMARSLLNLVNNALKYSQDRKFIGVNLYRDNGSVKLEVVDQGIGIPHQEQQKIFEKFYRVGDPLVHNTKGSGLGLSLVRHIVQAHGGEVAVDSAPGQGSKFTIVLPVKNRATAAAAARATCSAAVGSKVWQEATDMTRILIVEDEPNMVAGLRDNFEFEGYDVITAPDGVAGLERALKEAPDLVILDVMMPRMSGLDVCKQLKAKRPSMPIIMLTARGQEVDKVVGLELGADDYVTKPFSIRELLARVKAVLRRAKTVPKEQERYSFGDVEVNLKSCQVSRSGKALDFSSKEFELLKYFLCHPGETLSRDRLLEDVWGYDRFPTTRTVDAHIVRLRQKVEPKPEEPRFILTVHGRATSSSGNEVASNEVNEMCRNRVKFE